MNPSQKMQMTILERLIKRRRKRIVSFLNKLSLLYDEDPDYFADDPEPEPELEIISDPEVEPESEITDEILPEPESETTDEILPETESDSEHEIIEELEPEKAPDLESEVTEECRSEPEISEEAVTEPVPTPQVEPEPKQEAMTVEPEPEQEAMTVEPKPKQKTLMIEPEQPVSEIKKPEPVIVEFQYSKEAITLSEIIERAKKACGNKAGTLNIYIKPEENRVYFASGDSAGSFEI